MVPLNDLSQSEICPSSSPILLNTCLFFLEFAHFLLVFRQVVFQQRCLALLLLQFKSQLRNQPVHQSRIKVRFDIENWIESANPMLPLSSKEKSKDYSAPPSGDFFGLGNIVMISTQSWYLVLNFLQLGIEHCKPGQNNVNLYASCSACSTFRKSIWFNEQFSTAERSERVENFLFRATRKYTEAGIEQAIVAMRRLGANSPEPRKRAVREWHVSTQKTGSYITERSRLPGLIVGPCPSEESLCCPACPPPPLLFRRFLAPDL